MSTLNGVKRFHDSEVVEKAVFRNDITFHEVQDQYNHWAAYYDETLDDKPSLYNALMMYEEGMEKLFTDKARRRCLDLGAGTGLTGERLRKVGYSNFDGLEPNEKMAASSKKKGLYKQVIEEPIGGNQRLDIPDDSYDAICTAGSFAPGHIPSSAIPEIIRLLKPGGFFLNCMREEFLSVVSDYKDRLVPLLKDLELQGCIKLVEWKIYPNHYTDKTGVRMVYQKL